MSRATANPRELEPTPVRRVWGGPGLPEYGLGMDAGHPTGEWWLPTRDFPLLVKIIDARQNLSVQLHPDDATAHAMGLPNGKTEAWTILAADPGARIYLGILPEVGDDRFLSAARRGEDVSEHLQVVEPRVGDTLFVPPGTVHAIGAGIILLEVQQISETTFRIFDWNRQPARELHLDQAAACLRRDPTAGLAHPVSPDPARPGRVLLRSSLFELIDLELHARTRIDPEANEIWFCRQGAADIEGSGTPLPVRTGGFAHVTGGPITVDPGDGETVHLLRIIPR